MRPHLQIRLATGALVLGGLLVAAIVREQQLRRRIDRLHGLAGRTPQPAAVVRTPRGIGIAQTRGRAR